MKRYVIADTHFGHENIIRYCGRPFINAEQMDEALINKWNGIVGNDDLVYILGDFSLSHKKEKITELLFQLHGKKVLVMGNHDTHKPSYYVDCGFDAATRKPIMAEPGVILMHKPFEDLSWVCPKYIYFFGHVHNKRCPMDEYPNCRCVSAERIGYRPIDLDIAIKEIRRK